MLKIELKNRYNKQFVCRDIPKILISSIVTDIRADKSAIRYLQENAISISSLRKCLENNVMISSIDSTSLIIYFDNNAKITDALKLDAVLRSIDFGDRNFRGTGIVSKCFKYINNNINTLYTLSMLKGGIA